MSTSEDRSPQRRFHLGDGRIPLAAALLLCWPVRDTTLAFGSELD